jgi:hypothetical protein
MTLFAAQSREQLRGAYRDAWLRRCAGLPLQPLEAQIADVVAAHPEYQALLTEEAGTLEDFEAAGSAANPFLHMGLHLALRDQVGTDRPAGIAAIHQHLAARSGDRHAAEHRMIEVLAQVLSEAQRSGLPPPEALYLDRLRQL